MNALTDASQRSTKDQIRPTLEALAKDLTVKTQTAVRRLAHSEIVISFVDRDIGIQAKTVQTEERRITEYSFLPRGIITYTWFPHSRNKIPVVQGNTHPQISGAMCYDLQPSEGVQTVLNTRITIYPSQFLQSDARLNKYQRQTDTSFQLLTTEQFMGLYRALLNKR